MTNEDGHDAPPDNLSLLLLLVDDPPLSLPRVRHAALAGSPDRAVLFSILLFLLVSVIIFLLGLFDQTSDSSHLKDTAVLIRRTLQTNQYHHQHDEDRKHEHHEFTMNT